MIKRDKQEISTETYLKTKTKKEDMEKADTIIFLKKRKKD